MCGIAGIVAPDASGLRERIMRMLDAQRHRGPDDEGMHVDGAIALGHVRLSIVDLSDAGHQPMLADEGRLALVYNGEIYNHLEIRRELESLGHEFRSRSDTEVILRAYDQWGLDLCRHFNGMWGFALYDRARNRLVCARDRFGVKPFYYATTGGEFIFASEIKAILTAAPHLARADHAYVARFLHTSITDDDERTFFADIRQLPAGHMMVVDTDGERPSPRPPSRFWAFDPDRARADYDYSDPTRTFRGLLADAVRLRLRSDVPVGTCLSGGLDSSSIVALASLALEEPVRTFSALYPQREFDESRFVRLINEKFATRAHEVRPQPERLLDVLPRISFHQDQPSAGPGLFSQWHVMEAAAGEVKVLLDGQGADELLGGYHPYYVDNLRSQARHLLGGPTPGAAAGLLRGALTTWGALGAQSFRLLALGLLSEQTKRWVRPLVGSGARSEVQADYRRGWSHEEDPWAVHGPFGDRLDNVLFDAVFRRSLPALLRYEDRSSMAFSLEARTPFLDYRLVEFALALPFSEKIDGRWTKSVLRRAVDDILPSEVTWRRDKMGYPTPFSHWLRDEFRVECEEILFSPEFRHRGIFDMRVVDRQWRRHLSGAEDVSWSVWRWLSVEMWFRMFIDGGARGLRERMAAVRGERRS